MIETSVRKKSEKGSALTPEKNWIIKKSYTSNDSNRMLKRFNNDTSIMRVHLQPIGRQSEIVVGSRDKRFLKNWEFETKTESEPHLTKGYLDSITFPKKSTQSSEERWLTVHQK